jgi:hypothetical protein
VVVRPESDVYVVSVINVLLVPLDEEVVAVEVVVDDIVLVMLD